LSLSRLNARIQEIGEKAGLAAVACAYHDFHTGEQFEHDGDRLFHAASTFKAAVLLGLLDAAANEEVRLEDQLHVRNRFLSIVNGAPYRIDRERDGDSDVHRHVGRSLPLRKLAHAMITWSSNLATNLLLDFLTVQRVQDTLVRARIKGVIVRRGVEDILAHERGINNEASAQGLVELFRTFVEGDVVPPPFRNDGVDILLQQQFNRMIPAPLPSGVRVAHKTGEISTHSHDAGLVYVPDREPYALAILTESTAARADQRTRAVAEISDLIFRHLKEAKG
jgi:beta-lactamase class A